ncbi:hypothetical protein [Candidatus Ruthia endofausta]|uniref:hypothetical protein n=1 Tax=Candidatus Ruthia endofausta TaxID=2738852 RepID=UPI0030FC237A
MILQASENGKKLTASNGNVLELTVSEDSFSGDYTRLTKSKDGYCINCFGTKSHDYPEDIFIISGRVYDKAFEQWLETDTYASRPPGEGHGPFIADGDVTPKRGKADENSLSSIPSTYMICVTKFDNSCVLLVLILLKCTASSW